MGIIISEHNTPWWHCLWANERILYRFHCGNNHDNRGQMKRKLPRNNHVHMFRKFMTNWYCCSESYNRLIFNPQTFTMVGGGGTKIPRSRITGKLATKMFDCLTHCMGIYYGIVAIRQAISQLQQQRGMKKEYIYKSPTCARQVQPCVSSLLSDKIHTPRIRMAWIVNWDSQFRMMRKELDFGSMKDYRTNCWRC